MNQQDVHGRTVNPEMVMVPVKSEADTVWMPTLLCKLIVMVFLAFTAELLCPICAYRKGSIPGAKQGAR
jgi:hypothetical protein